MVAHLFRKVTIFLIEPNILKRLALQGRKAKGKELRKENAYEHGVERLRDTADSRRIVRHRECRHKSDST
jgi:hypothetical protein